MVTFARPPLVEVSLGRVFLGRTDFLIPHMGLFAQAIAEKYPKASHAQIIVSEGGNPVVDTLGNWLPRLWLTSSDEVWLVQLQQDRLYVNWRSMDGTGEYVRFPAVRAEFDRLWGLLDACVMQATGSALSPTHNELTYSNLVRQGEGWTEIADISEVIHGVGWPAAPKELGVAAAVSSKAHFALPDAAGQLRLVVETGRLSVRDAGAHVLKIEFQARGPVQNNLSWDRWVDIAHDRIVKGFKAVTTERMHRTFWKAEDS